MSTTYGATTNRYPGREQNLFIGQMKHLHVLKDGLLKYQKKELDARASGKSLITRFLIFDLDSMMAYGECHSDETKHDLSGFLARAWSAKPDHPMHGIPTVLNVPRVVFKNEGYRADIEGITRTTGITIGALPTGFGEGVHAIKRFDEHVRSLCDRGLSLSIAQNCSAAISNRIRSWWGAIMSTNAGHLSLWRRMHFSKPLTVCM